jgi:hypothetical protein
LAGIAAGTHGRKEHIIIELKQELAFSPEFQNEREHI